MHRLLDRQIKKHLDAAGLATLPADWKDFLSSVEKTYREDDRLRRVLERCVDATSEEMGQAARVYHRVLDLFPDIVFRLNDTGMILECLGGLPEDYLRPPHKLLGKKIFDLPLPPVAKKLQEAMELAKHTRAVVTVEYSLTLHGWQNSFEARLRPVDEGEIFMSVRNITRQKRLQDETHRTVSLLKSTLESAADGILVLDATGRILTFNQRFVQMWRIPQDILDSADDDKAIDHVLNQLADPEKFLAKVRELVTQPTAESFDVLEFKDRRVFERYSAPQFLEGEAIGRVWSFRDVTQKKRAEERILERTQELEKALKELRDTQERVVRSEKLAVIGQLASGVSHELRNPLGALRNVVYYIRDALQGSPVLESDPSMKEFLDMADREIKNATAIISDLLDFSRVVRLVKQSVDVHEVLGDMKQVLEKPANIQIVEDFAPGLPRGQLDPQKMRQVFLNLANNAVQAMPNGGDIRISTRMEGDSLLVDFADKGVGVAPENLQKIFEPLFTTKSKGTGLGLAICAGIVEAHGGKITVASEVGRGSVFSVRIPWGGPNDSQTAQ